MEIKLKVMDIHIDGKLLNQLYERENYSFDQGDYPKIISTYLLRSTPHLAVQPKDVNDIVTVFRYARKRCLAVVPRGTASSALGGSVPVKGGIVIDLSSLNAILKINETEMLITVESGVRWAQLDQALKKYGLGLKTYPSSWFSTVGGWISTGGYGINSLKFGSLKSQIKCLEVVSANGEIRQIKPDDKYFNMYFQTEGQMGIITKVTLQVRKRPTFLTAKLVYLPEEVALVSFIHQLTKTSTSPSHIMYLDSQRMNHVNQILGGGVEEKPSLLIALESIEEIQKYWEVKQQFNGVIEAPEYLASYLWRNRLFPMKAKRFGPGLLGCEILLDISSVPEFLHHARKLGRKFQAHIASEAHVINENLSLVICSWLSDSRRSLVRLFHLALVLMLQELGLEYGGRIYSVGLWNTPLLFSRFSDRYASELWKFKREIDPNRILNPGKFFEIGARGGLSFLFNSSLIRFLLKMMQTTAPILGRITHLDLDGIKLKRYSTDTLNEAVYGCARCGACVPLCPAYLVTNDETVTGRGKLFIARKLLEGVHVGENEAQRIFLCMHCRACQDVCQSGLKLVETWDKLEDLIEKRFGKPMEEIADFVDAVEANRSYQSLLDEGVYGKISPRNENQ